MKLSQLSTDVISDQDTFHGLRNEWNSLLDRSRSVSAFLRWEWLYSWWKHFGLNYQLRIITVRDNSGQLVGIGPFCIGVIATPLKARSVFFLGSIATSSEYLDLIAHPTMESDVTEAILHRLLDDDATPGCAIFSDSLHNGIIRDKLRDSHLTSQYVVFTDPAEVCPYLSFDRAPDELFAGFESRLRSTIKRKGRKLSKLGGRYSVVQSESELDTCLDDLFHLHQKRWALEHKDGSFATETIKAFHRDVCHSFLASGCLRLHYLTLDEATVATLYAFSYKGIVSYVQAGLDPDFTRLSPGTVLLWEVIKSSQAEGAVEFDFLRGDETYKSLWTDTQRVTERTTLIRTGRVDLRSAALLQKMYREWRSNAKRIATRLNLISR